MFKGALTAVNITPTCSLITSRSLKQRHLCVMRIYRAQLRSPRWCVGCGYERDTTIAEKGVLGMWSCLAICLRVCNV